MVTKLKVLFVTHHWKNNSHHSKSGGYQRLVDFMPTDKIEPTVLTWGDRDKIYYQPNGIKVIIKKVPTFLRFIKKRKILANYSATLSKDFDIVHAIYDDVAPLKTKTPLISNFHTIKDLDKASWWLKFRFNNQLKIMKRSNKIIVLSNNMREILGKYTPKEKIEVIPHGVDTEYFKPVNKVDPNLLNLKKKYKLAILCIGNYGTNREEIIEKCRNFKEILFIVINNNWNGKIPQMNNVLFFRRVSEEKLLELYTLADIFYRPLKFSSANNSILEAQSVGLFILTNETEGVIDYLKKGRYLFIEDMGGINSLLTNKKLSHFIKKERVLDFDWYKIAERTIKIYEEVIKDVK